MPTVTRPRKASASFVYARNEFDGGTLSAWTATTPTAEETIESKPNFFRSQVGWLDVLRGKALIAGLSEYSDGDSTTTAYCYRTDRLVRMRTTIFTGDPQSRWVATTYYFQGEPVGPFIRAVRHGSNAPAPQFQAAFYPSPRLLPFFALYAASRNRKP